MARPISLWTKKSCSDNARFSGQIGGSSNQPKTVTDARYAEVAIQPRQAELQTKLERLSSSAAPAQSSYRRDLRMRLSSGTPTRPQCCFQLSWPCLTLSRTGQLRLASNLGLSGSAYSYCMTVSSRPLVHRSSQVAGRSTERTWTCRSCYGLRLKRETRMRWRRPKRSRIWATWSFSSCWEARTPFARSDRPQAPFIPRFALF